MPKRCTECRTAERELKRCTCSDHACNLCTWALKRLDDCACTAKRPAVVGTSEMFTIEKNVPIPIARTGVGKWQALASKLQAGESVLLPTRKKADYLVRCLKRTGHKATIRSVENGVRVWRTE